MTDRILTYHSLNAPADRAWLAFIDMSGKTLGITFTASSEDEVKERVRTFWAREREKREAREPKGGKKTMEDIDQ